MTKKRPDPPYVPGVDRHWEVRPDPAWSFGGAPDRPCQWPVVGHQGCGQPSVASLKRWRNTAKGQVAFVWFYCPSHMYGAWIEDGQVVRYYLLVDESVTGP